MMNLLMMMLLVLKMVLTMLVVVVALYDLLDAVENPAEPHVMATAGSTVLSVLYNKKRVA